jgi:hypothetical protein
MKVGTLDLLAASSTSGNRYKERRLVLRSFGLYLKALWSQGKVLLTGGTLMALMAFWALATGESLPYNVGLLILGLTFIGASFLAWKKEHDKASSSSEEYHLELARKGLEDIGPASFPLLRHLMIHGTLTFGRHDPPVPEGLNARDLHALLSVAVNHQLVTNRHHDQPGGEEESFEIAPGMAAALRQLLYGSEASSQTR